MLKYIKEIKAPWVMEVISERFDDVLNRLPPTAIVYGGAVRDVLAGKPLKGDLDIAITDVDYTDLLTEFDRAVKWKSGEVDEATMEALQHIPIKKNKKAEIRVGLLDTAEDLLAKRRYANSYESTTAPPVPRNRAMAPPSFSRVKSRNYKFGSRLPLANIATFVTFNNKEIQIISSKSTGHELEDSIYIARYVDIVCCGVIMTTDGKVYEVVKGAYEDCIQNILRFNDLEDNIVSINRLRERITKLTERGWKSEINIKKLSTVINKRTALLKKKEKAANLKRLKQSGLSSPHSFKFTDEYVDTCGGIETAKKVFFDILNRNGIDRSNFRITKTSKGYTFTDRKRRKSDVLIQIKKVFERALLKGTKNESTGKTKSVETLVFEIKGTGSGLTSSVGLNIRTETGSMLGAGSIPLQLVNSSNSITRAKYNLLFQIQRDVSNIPGLSLHNLQNCILRFGNAPKMIQTLCRLITKTDLEHYFPPKMPSVCNMPSKYTSGKIAKEDLFVKMPIRGKPRSEEVEEEGGPAAKHWNGAAYVTGSVLGTKTGRTSSTKVNKGNLMKKSMKVMNASDTPPNWRHEE